MKTLLALILALGIAMPAAVAQTSKTKPGAKAPVAPAAVDAKDSKKKEDEMGKVEGMEIARANGKFLGIRIVDGVFRLTFYNKKRKPEAPDIPRAVLRWDAKYKLGEERTVLNLGGDPNSLTSAKVIRPPLTFKLFITMLATGADGTDTAVENYTIDFRQ